MSALLDEIIDAATDGKQPLPDILRKCLRLAHELKNERLKAWANQELNGYDDATTLPPYRIVQAQAKGNFLGPLRAEYRAHIIPPVVIEERHQDIATKIHLTQSVSAYHDLCDGADGVLAFPWPANMVVYYQARIMGGGFILHSAWQEIPPNVIVEMLDTIRNRTLNMALEIKDELGKSYADLRKVESSDAGKIQNIVVQNIGGTNYQTFGESSLDASTHTVIAVGDRQALHSILGKSGLENADLDKLNEAFQSDGDKKLGSKVGAWIKENAPKVIAGGVKVGVKIGQEILTEWLKQYCGL